MARIIKLKGQLRFRKSEPKAEQSKEVISTSDGLVGNSSKQNLSPFQRVKNGAGECFLATDAIPLKYAVN